MANLTTALPAQPKKIAPTTKTSWRGELTSPINLDYGLIRPRRIVIDAWGFETAYPRRLALMDCDGGSSGTGWL